MCDVSDPCSTQVLSGVIAQAVREAIGDSLKKWDVQPRLVLRIDEVAAQIGLSPSTIRNLLDSEGQWFDPEFPKPIRLGNGAGVRSAIGWRRADILGWVDSRPTHEISHQVSKKISEPNIPSIRRKSISNN
ncbi:hypothetical protein ASD68_01580 [Rhodanobacter sp. Root627]|nr:hypothetical protein ASD68_01580 [Rhodanobacter sp. Root627]